MSRQPHMVTMLNHTCLEQLQVKQKSSNYKLKIKRGMDLNDTFLFHSLDMNILE